MEGLNLSQNLLIGLSCLSIFTCTIRSDYNFPFGLLCFYMLRTTEKHAMTAKVVLYILVSLIVCDLAYVVTMWSVWQGKPVETVKDMWEYFSVARYVTLGLSILSILLKIVTAVFINLIRKGGQASK